MARICHDCAEYSRRLQLGEDATKVKKIAHSLQDASSAAAKAQNDQVALPMQGSVNVRMPDCLDGIEPCKCKRKGH